MGIRGVTYVVCALLVGSYVAYAAEKALAYLPQSINRIDEVFRKSTVLSKDDAVAVAQDACTTLTRLVNDPEFRAVLDKASSKFHVSKEEKEAIAATYRDVGKLNAFIAVEAQQLHADGYSDSAAADIIARMISGANLSNADYFAFKDVIYKLRDRSCDLAKTHEVNSVQAEVIRTGLIGVGVFSVDAAFSETVVADASFEFAITAIGDALLKLL